MELGRVGLKERDVADLLTLYGVADDRERDRMLSLVRQANTPGWWYSYNDVLPGWFESYLGLEAAAATIQIYEVQLVPGLLQTREYAHAVMTVGQGGFSGGEIERWVDLRMSRQHLLHRDGGPCLRVVLDESVLQVLPFSAGAHAAVVGAFTILGLPDPDLNDVIYLEHLTSALYLDRQDDVSQYAKIMSDLCARAEPPDRTAEIFERLQAAVNDS